MTWTVQGVWQGNHATNLSLSNVGVGDLIIAEVINFSNSSVWCTGLTGGGVTWLPAGVKFSGSVNPFAAAVFLGTVTATGAGTATPSWSGTAPADWGIASREFSSSVGSWSFVTQANLDSAGTSTWPTLNAQAGDLYFGYAANASAAGTVSTTGYTGYSSSADGVGNGATFNVNCPSGLTGPVWSDSGQALGIMILVREGAAAPAFGPEWPAQPSWPAPMTSRFGPAQPFAPPPSGVPAVVVPPPPPGVPPPPPGPLPPALPGLGLPGMPGGTPFATWPVDDQRASPVQVQVPYIAGLGGSGYNSWFVDQNGQPRLAVVEQGWALAFNAGRFSSGNYQADFTTYFSTRAAQGYTAWYGVAHGSTHIDASATGGKSWDGLFVLTVNGTPGNIATGAETVGLNSAYWSRIDALFNTARQYGITCFLNMGLTYDFSDAGGIWEHATNTQAGQFGAALAARYPQSSYPNVFWFWGDDDGGGNDSFWAAILTGMQGAGDARGLISIEYLTNENSHVQGNNGTAVGTFGAASATYSWNYSYDAPYFLVERTYTEGGSFTHIPALYGDGIYYGDSGGGPSVETAIRTFTWWALASGSRGFPSTSGPSFADADALWMFATSAAFGRVSSDPNGTWTTTNVKRIATYFSGLTDWHKLIPDTGSVFVTAGRGTRGTMDVPGSGFNVRTGNTYVAASITPTGTLAVVYCRAAMSITIDQSKLGGGYTATWVDPSNPTLTQSATTGSTYSSSGLGNNAAGQPDWVLVFQGPATGGAVNAVAGVAAATGIAPAVSLAASAAVGPATATGTAPGPAVAAAAALAAVLASATGTAPGVNLAGSAAVGPGAGTGTAPAVGLAATVAAGLAAGTGTALAAAATAADSPAAGLAAATGTAPGATAQTSGSTSAVAGLASATGTAPAVTAAVTVAAALAAATGSAPPVGLAASVAAALAAAAGAALAPAPAPADAPHAGLAAATGAALTPAASTAPQVQAAAGLASAAGTAPGAGLVLTLNVAAGLAAATAAAPAATGQQGRTVAAGAALATGLALGPGLALASRPPVGLAVALGAALPAAGVGRVPAVYGTAVAGGGPAVASSATGGAGPVSSTTTGRP